MQANAAGILDIFEKKIRLEVPLFQRQYVWNREQQWEPLWEDIARKFSDYLQGQRDSPVHFLGAMVLDQRQSPTTHVEKRQVIDGQQRLTTLQVFLAAFRDFCSDSDCPELAREADAFVLNRGMMADPSVDCFKVWPTQLDRAQFTSVISAGSREAVVARHPLTRDRRARRPNARPRMVEAYLFFYERLTEFFFGSDGDPVLLATASTPLAQRAEECFQALRSALQVVVIDLDRDDDAQVIFETLNARGEPLLPADLLRNFIFLRAAREGADPEALYNAHWRRFDDPFWRVEVKQGRLSRPRSDLYIQHFLASRKAADIPVKHLFVEYKHWIAKDRPFATIDEELATLARQGDAFRRIIEPQRGDDIYGLVRFLDAFDIRTVYPLLLRLLDTPTSGEAWHQIGVAVESYLVRRAVCGLPTKNYNRVFLQLTKALLLDGNDPARTIHAQLSSLSGESSVWPDDEDFKKAWLGNHAYRTLQNAKLVHIFRRLNEMARTNRNEEISIAGNLTVEHLLPQDWLQHWPLADGAPGVPLSELWTAGPEDARAAASKLRNQALQTIGNLTLLSQPLNSAVSNREWSLKRAAILDASLLPLNLSLQQFDKWDEEAITRRGLALFSHATLLWPSPARSAPR